MNTLKIIAIISLLLIGFHLLLYGYVKRRIASAKRADELLNMRDHNSD
jgi:hypothetical protein